MIGKLLKMRPAVVQGAAASPAVTACPKCRGRVIAGDLVLEPGDVVCLQCGWRGYATLSAEVLREARA